jgi:hypothetical protein
MSESKPASIGMADPRSFARYTLDNRFPAIINEVIAVRPGGPCAENLAALRRETAEGRIADPFGEDACKTKRGLRYSTELFLPGEREAWRTEISKYTGRLWKDTPFYFAEAYLYLNILLAAGYYDRASPYFQLDPFEPSKTAELSRFLTSAETQAAAAAFSRMAETLRHGRAGTPEAAGIFEKALLFMLKANRIDLSNARIAEEGRKLMRGQGRDDLLVDHTEALARRLFDSRRADIIPDNAGAELAADLIFVWLYLESRPDRQVVLHAKKAPTFVSDAMIKDVSATVEKLKSLPGASRAGQRLEDFLRAGRLRLLDHYFWNGPKHFPDLPEDIREELSSADITLLKGDANFRRLIEDRSWPFAANLAELTPWFPGTYAVLRTLKSEVAADIPEALSQKMYREDPAWLTNGRWGCVRLVVNS